MPSLAKHSLALVLICVSTTFNRGLGQSFLEYVDSQTLFPIAEPCARRHSVLAGVTLYLLYFVTDSMGRAPGARSGTLLVLFVFVGIGMIT